MGKRKIIAIDEEKCNGCGLCIPNCPEGALRIIDGKVRLIGDLFCDGLGACIGHCPEGAIRIEEREAEPYDEKKAMENIVRQGENTVLAHLDHLRDHGEAGYLKQALDFLQERGIDIGRHKQAKRDLKPCAPSQCPGSMAVSFDHHPSASDDPDSVPEPKNVSELRQWPVQLALVPPFAPYLNGAHLLIAADCVPFAYPDFHADFLKGKVLLIACPKLDDTEFYMEKLTEIFKINEIKSITCVHMEVPCCFGLKHLISGALAKAGKEVSVENVVVSIKGGRS